MSAERETPALGGAGVPISCEWPGSRLGQKAIADRPRGKARCVGRFYVRDHAWDDDPKIVSVERRAGKAGYVDVRLAGHTELVTVKTTDLLSYPKFRARIFDVTGHMYGPIPADEWEWVLLRALRDQGAAS